MFGRRVELDPLSLRPFTARVETSEDDSRERALLFHIGELSRATQQLQISTISYINFAGLVSVGALTVGLLEPEPLVEIFAPYALAAILAFLLQLYTDIERLVTIREVLEGHLNLCLAKPAFLGINWRSRRHRGRGSVRLSAALLAGPLLFFAYHSMETTAKATASRWYFPDHFDRHCANLIGIAFCGSVVTFALVEMLQITRRATAEAEEVLGATPRLQSEPPGWIRRSASRVRILARRP
jgi:hypothetical protein